MEKRKRTWALVGAGLLACAWTADGKAMSLSCDLIGCTNSLFEFHQDYDDGYIFTIHEQVAEYLPTSHTFQDFFLKEGLTGPLDEPEFVSIKFSAQDCAHALNDSGDVACKGLVTVSSRILGGIGANSGDGDRQFAPYQMLKPVAEWTGEVHLNRADADPQNEASTPDRLLQIRITSSTGGVFQELGTAHLSHCL